MTLRIHNSLSRAVEPFEPIEPTIEEYVGAPPEDQPESEQEDAVGYAHVVDLWTWASIDDALPAAALPPRAEVVWRHLARQGRDRVVDADRNISQWRRRPLPEDWADCAPAAA